MEPSTSRSTGRLPGTRVSNTKPWEETRPAGTGPLDLSFEGDTGARNTSLVFLLDKKPNSSNGDANQKPTLCPCSVLGDEGGGVGYGGTADVLVLKKSEFLFLNDWFLHGGNEFKSVQRK